MMGEWWYWGRRVALCPTLQLELLFELLTHLVFHVSSLSAISLQAEVEEQQPTSYGWTWPATMQVFGAWKWMWYQAGWVDLLINFWTWNFSWNFTHFQSYLDGIPCLSNPPGRLTYNQRYWGGCWHLGVGVADKRKYHVTPAKSRIIFPYSCLLLFISQQ